MASLLEVTSMRGFGELKNYYARARRMSNYTTQVSGGLWDLPHIFYLLGNISCLQDSSLLPAACGVVIVRLG